MIKSVKGVSLETRVEHFQTLIRQATASTLGIYNQALILSWIYHDSSLEGVVYSAKELEGAMDETKLVIDPSVQQIHQEIRQSKEAILFIQELAEKKRSAITLDVVKKLYSILCPEDSEGKGGPKYRKEIPLHRLYFHEISPPDKISYRLRQSIQWVNDVENRKSMHIVRLATKLHYEILHIYPFPQNSGKIARLVMNALLMQSGYPAAVIHATERQRYYEALRASEDAVANLVQEALSASVESGIHFFEQQQS